MKKHRGSIINYLNATTQNAAQAESAYHVQQIDAERIIPNEKNFYSIEGVEEMANSLAVSDHMPPLEVVDNGDGTYRLISGERRLSATLCRIRRGELEKATLPCHILPSFTAKGALSAEQVEMLHIILANNYRQKTALDQLNEVKQMEPIARAIYDDAKEKGALAESEGSSLNMRFRTFFAKEILDISEAKLQRLQSLTKLTEKARKAFDEGLIGKTVAAQMASLSPEEQDNIVYKIRSGTCDGTYAEFKDWLEGRKRAEEEEEASLPLWEEDGETHISDRIVDGGTSEEKTSPTAEEPLTGKEPQRSAETSAADSAGADEDVTETAETSDEDASDAAAFTPQASERTEDQIPQPLADRKPDAAPTLSALSVGQAEKEANLWVAERLQALVEEVEAKIRAAEEMHESVDAARWEVRRSAIRLIIETIS
ncbi:ParB N-terminal domain-containing protein [uncultured Selenomonas sp.]|uniref:ParB/RepB/Spo0J family partition protein n=1 Tax=uncultured Selenomonas sp. TaxID=159275 RepID=UPI0028DD3775|nr:ParB N-terminal domain-containing protein [uncultured Selenomonas sp.]